MENENVFSMSFFQIDSIRAFCPTESQKTGGCGTELPAESLVESGVGIKAESECGIVFCAALLHGIDPVEKPALSDARNSTMLAMSFGLPTRPCPQCRPHNARREQKSILDSAKLLHSTIPGSTLEILPGLRHGDLSINHPELYVRMLRELGV